MKHKNWSLFMWALEHLKVGQRCLRNKILLRLMDLSGVTPKDVSDLIQEIDNELKRREEL